MPPAPQFRRSSRVLSRAFRAGFMACLPVLPGVAAFGLILGVAMVSAGLTPFTAFAMSVIAFAGTAQLAALQLAGLGTPLVVILFAATIINLRFVLYSLSLSPYVRHAPRRMRALLAYSLTDNGYAHAIARFAQYPRTVRKPDFLLGACAAIWLTWQIASMVGATLGAGLPSSWSLEYTIALTFIAMGVNAIRDRAAVVAAVASGAVALAAHALPFRLSLIIAAGAGIGAGVLAEQWKKRWTPSRPGR